MQPIQIFAAGVKAVVFLPTQICALIYVMLNWKIFLQYVFVFGGLRPVILYSLQELEWKLCFPIYRATWPCCLHKAYLQYLGGFGFSFCFVVQMPSLKKRSALCMLPNRKACSLPGPLQRDPQNTVMWKNKCLRLGLHGLSAEIPAVGVPVAISRAAALGGHAVGVLGAVRGAPRSWETPCPGRGLEEQQERPDCISLQPATPWVWHSSRGRPSKPSSERGGQAVTKITF